MTIIKVSRDGKAIIKKKVDETAIPLAPENTDLPVRAVQVRVTPAVRSRRCFNIILLMIALLVLATGIIGGVYLFKYMIHRNQRCRISVQYEEDPADFLDTPPEKMPTPVPQGSPHGEYFVMEEEVDIVEEDEMERIEVPRFDECRRSVVIHDFRMNLTVIVDNDDGECFLMDLDREHLSPPKSFAELIRKYTSGYYMPKVDVIRRDYQIMQPALQDLQFAGINIMMECTGYNTYRLEKREPIRQIFDIQLKKVKAFGYSDLKTLIKDHILIDFN